jgi:hypothetical protein
MTRLKESRTIEMISYLSDGQRKIVMATANGTFTMNTVEEKDGRRKFVKKDLTAREFTEHPDVKDSDPVITLKTGEKIRVYVGADSSYLPAMVDGVMEKNDSFEVLRRRFLEERQKREDSRKKDQKKGSDTDEYDNPFAGWDFDYYD